MTMNKPFNYSFKNNKRDLSDILSTVIHDEPRFILLFKTLGAATENKHEWVEDATDIKSIDVADVHSTDTEHFFRTFGEIPSVVRKGTVLVPYGESCVFIVSEVKNNAVYFELLAKNGSMNPVVKSGDRLIIVAGEPDDKVPEGTVTNFNYIQKFHKLINVNPSTDNWCNYDNQVNRETYFSLSDLARSLNRAALFGVRGEDLLNGSSMAGGLYDFASDKMVIKANGRRICKGLISEAVDMIVGAGAEPSTIICTPAQARAIVKSYGNSFQVTRSDERRGAYTLNIVNELSGRGLSIIADPDIPNNDVWVVDPDCFGIVYKNVSDVDITKDTDSVIQRLVTAELSFVFNKSSARCCRISGVADVEDVDSFKCSNN